MTGMWLRIILGALYLAMAGGQLLSWSEMPILSTYDAFPVAVLPVLTATRSPQSWWRVWGC